MTAMNKKEWSIVCTVQTWAVVIRKKPTDQRIKPSFTVGDIVYVYRPVVTPGRQRTFIRPWVGTFYIAEKLSPFHVKIRRKSDGKLIKNRVHMHRLKHGFAGLCVDLSALFFICCFLYFNVSTAVVRAFSIFSMKEIK
jgi:hypothetical protein